MNEKYEVKRLVINTALIAFGNMGAKLISFLLLPLYTRTLSTESYGKYDFIITVSMFLIPVVSLSIYESLFRFLIEMKQKNDEEGLKRVISSSFIITIVCLAIYIVISSIIYKITSISYIPIMTLYVIANILYTYLISVLRGIDQIKYYAVYSGIKNSGQVILSFIAVAHLNLGVNGLLYATIITSLGVSILIFIQFKLWIYLSIKHTSCAQIKSMLGYAIPLVPDSVSATIVSMSDRIVVCRFLGNSMNGIYSIAHKFPSVIEVVYHFFITAWNESASRVHEANKNQVEKYYQGLYEHTKRILIGVVICIISIMPIMFKILIRGDYTQAFYYVPLLLIAQLLNCIANFYSGILIANKDTKKIARSTIIAALINIVLNIVLVEKWNINGILVATIISNGILLVQRKKTSGIYIKLREDIKYLVWSSLVLAIVLVLYKYNNIWMCFTSIAISVLFFCITNVSVIMIVFNGIKGKLSAKLN